MKILFQGDSITDMSRSRESDLLGQSYALMVAGDLSGHFPGCYEFVNRGISGNRIVDLYARIKADAWNLEPDVMSILIGVNDVWHEFGGHNGVEVDRYEKVYRMLIEDTKAKLPNIKLMLMEPFVLKASGTAENWEEFRSEVEARAEVVQRLAKEYGLAFVPLQERLDQACDTVPPSYWLPDGVHPSPAGHRLIADAWLEVFNRDIK